MKKVNCFLTSFLIVTFWLIPFHAYAESDRPNNLFSETFILVDATTGEVLLNQGSEKRMYPASITKIVTAILALESGQLDEQVTISKKAATVEGTRVYLLEGEQMPLRQLVEGLMINSGNDAAIAIAEHLAGSVEEFSNQMNTFVTDQLGLENTNFVNPSGLYDENHYTTASDMAQITQYALENEDFKQIVGTKTLPWIGKGWDTTLVNHHKLLWRYDGTFGVKNGYTSQSQHTLVTAAKKGETSYIAVTMKSDTSEQAYADTIALMDYGFENFETKKIERGTVLVDEAGKEYTLKEDKFFTQPIGEKFKTTMDREGNLIVTNMVDEELASFPLLPDEVPEESVATASSEPTEAVMGDVQQEDEEGPAWAMFTLITLAALLLLFILNGYRLKLKRRRKRDRMDKMLDEINHFRR